MGKSNLQTGQKIGLTILTIVIGLILMAVFAGGAEFGNFKIPFLGKTIVANVDVERTIFDVDLVKTSIDVRQGTFSVQTFSFFLPDSSTFFGEKKLILKLYVDGQFCEKKEFTIEGLGGKSRRLTCKTVVGVHDVRIDLFDTKGLEDSFSTKITIT